MFDYAGWSNLAKVVYARTYSRSDTGRLEDWPESVDRAIRGNVRGHNVKPEEIERLRFFMMNRKASPAGRGLWFSGAPSHERVGGAALCNCFRGTTRFWADGTLTSFKEAVGKTVKVLARDGEWRDAQVKAFGVQKLQRVTFGPKRSRMELTYDCTSNHRWFTARGEVNDLREGDVVRMVPVAVDETSPTYRAGVVHGLIFGDGYAQQTPGKFAIRLCGKKCAHLDVLKGAVEVHGGEFSVTYPPSWGGDPYFSCPMSVNAKAVPADSMCADYKAGFIHGWFLADGASRGRLTCSDPGALSWLKEWAPRAGYVLRGWSVDPSTETNFGPRTHPSVQVVLGREAMDYEVKLIEDLGVEEEVFCVTEPITASFTLAGGMVTGNCWTWVASDWMNLVHAMDLLMLGGGVGMSVEHEYVHSLPRIKRGVVVTHKPTKDADFIVPDSREGWIELLRRVLEAFFVTGRGFTYSTIIIRGAGEPIKGFGGKSSGPGPLISMITKICALRVGREGCRPRPIDVGDVLCCVGECVKSGNVRRSAILLLGDPWDRDFLRAKRWDLGIIPSQRSCANWSVNCDDVQDLHQLFWQTYEDGHGECFGLVNMANIRKFGRMGELRRDTAQCVNPCAEMCGENGEGCDLVEHMLPHYESIEEFVEGCRLFHRWAKRVACERFHIEKSAEVFARNMRVGSSVTGCMMSPLCRPDVLDAGYQAILAEDETYSRELHVPLSIRHTVGKPSGTLSKAMDMEMCEGAHAPPSRNLIQRVRFPTNHHLIPRLLASGHHMEPEQRLDGTVDLSTQVVDFYVHVPEHVPVVDEGHDTWKQLEVAGMLQRHWADQSVSVTVYFEPDEVPKIKQWYADHIDTMKTVSFLRREGHGFKQAPKEPISPQEYERLSAKIRPLDLTNLQAEAEEDQVEGLECSAGVCSVR